jgi:hypothetical protein
MSVTVSFVAYMLSIDRLELLYAKSKHRASLVLPCF